MLAWTCNEWDGYQRNRGFIELDVPWASFLHYNCHIRQQHDDVIKWKHFPRYWPFVRGIHRSPVNSPHKGQWRRALMFSLICVLINGWVNNGEGDDLRRYRAHYDVTVMSCFITTPRGAMPSIYRAINLALCSHQMETFSVLLALCVGNPPDSHWNYHSLSHALSHRTKSDHQVPRSTRSYLS